MVAEMMKQKGEAEEKLYAVIRARRRQDALKRSINIMSVDANMFRYSPGTKPCMLSFTDESLDNNWAFSTSDELLCADRKKAIQTLNFQ